VTGFDAVGSGGNAADCNGHGTHVAGTVGGTTFGVAKNVRLVAVRVLDCSGAGSLSGVIAGVDWVTANHVSPAVANMSLGGGSSTALDTAVRNSIGSGVTYVLAAGNSSADACGSSPARVAEAITVGAVTSSDARATYSNYGACLDLFAPGSSITSAWHTGPTATNTISGTSMASPHVTGVAALYLQLNPAARPDAVANAIVGSVTSGKVTSPGAGSPNRLLYSLLSGGGNNPPNPPVPPTDPGSPCSGCTAFTGNLAGPGDCDRQPLGTYYYSRVSGSHRAWLHGPAGADFDVYLYKLTGFGGFLVAWGDGPTSTEQVNYSGGPGYYMWIVRSFSGSGSYTFWLQKPPTTS
jgi:subtilisin family serine protease